MSKKFFIAAGAVVLSIAGFLNTQANKKFAGAQSCYFRTAGGNTYTIFKGKAATTSNLTDAITSGRTAFTHLNSSVNVKMFKNSNLTGTLFFK